VLTVRPFQALALTSLVVLLATFSATSGLHTAGWVVGLLCGVIVITVVTLGLVRSGSRVPGPADLVTLTRAVITCVLAALTADALLHHVVTPWFVPMTVTALVLDAADGWVARRTGTSSAFGNRFDGEVDAFLILVLSIYVAPRFGAWVLAAGLMRYAFAMAGWVMPWMHARLTYRYWRKVVTATQGIVLTFAAVDVLPPWLTIGALVVGLALLAESFGRDVCWLWRQRVAAGRADNAIGATAVTRPQPRTDGV
jgi:phosphatidylglycerophosphate synthase